MDTSVFRHIVREVACPKCGAAQGFVCRTMDDKQRKSNHALRIAKFYRTFPRNDRRALASVEPHGTEGVGA